MGHCHFFITLQFNCIYCVCVFDEEKSFLYYTLVLRSFELTMQESHPSLYSIKTLYHIFQIHSDRLQRMSTVLFKLVSNKQKSTRTHFLKYQGKMFLNIENVLVS